MRHLPASLALMVATTTMVVASQAFRSHVALVRLPVVVSSRANVPVEGLQSADFEVLENGRPRDVAAFAAGSSELAPLHLGLMLDRSLSMEADLQNAASAAIKFVGLMDDALDVTLVEFAADVRVSQYQPPDYLRLFQRIRETKLGPHTVFYEAVARYVYRVAARDGQHVLVAYTDGGDESSRLTAQDARDLLRAGDVILYAIGYLAHQSQADRFKQQPILTMLARETGGEAFFPDSPGQVSQVYERIRREIQGRYTLGFVPSPASKPGEFRRVEVRLKNRSRGDLRLRTRSGYIAVSAP